MAFPLQDYPSVFVDLVCNLLPSRLIDVRLLLESCFNLLGSCQIAPELLSLISAMLTKLTDMILKFEDLFCKTLSLLIGYWRFHVLGCHFRVIFPDPVFRKVPAGLRILKLRLVLIEFLPLLIGKSLSEAP